MEPSAIASVALPLLVKFIPVIWKSAKSLGEQAVDKVTDKVLDKAGESITDKSWETGRKLIKMLSSKLTPDSPVQKAMQDLAASPDDSDNQEILLAQLRKLLKTDSELMREVAVILNYDSSTQINITASGNRSVAAQNIKGLVITGDVHNGVTFNGNDEK